MILQDLTVGQRFCFPGEAQVYTVLENTGSAVRVQCEAPELPLPIINTVRATEPVELLRS